MRVSGDIPSPANPLSGCRFHTRCIHVTEGCGIEEPHFREVKFGHFVACHPHDDMHPEDGSDLSSTSASTPGLVS